MHYILYKIDYSPDLGDTSTSNIIHKPDAADLQPPPPPYSPDGGRKSSDSNYGSTSGAPLGIDEEQQVGLLSQQAQPFPAKKKRVLAVPSNSRLFVCLFVVIMHPTHLSLF